MGACLSCGSHREVAPAPEVPHRAGHSVFGKETEDVHAVYEFGKFLGRGRFGSTRLVTNTATGEQLACKSIAKHKLLKEQELLQEIQIMQHLAGHPNVVQLRSVHEDAASVHLVMELCRGGELADVILQRKQQFAESEAAAIMRTIAEAVAHCHASSVVHRDIKPENFLLLNSSEPAALQLADFGLSAFVSEGQRLSDVVGSDYYMAPEVHARSYGRQADMWSCGVILYLLLSGSLPFIGATQQEVKEAVREGEYELERGVWKDVSEHAKDCVRRMLHVDPAQRATAQEVLSHPWLQGMARQQSADCWVSV
ncbi:hypothetical protein OEZ85_001886 [Tetradesmus obliquus]|uniref:Protein kinase domain-containing protein n=1 Tax=Tetradesmus obliquus TaxID=3088 RepID=A0ABY8U1T4_TETOB|nr:hypothetical protein OEZ85_001886 [Tetradesmus obliquus]